MTKSCSPALPIPFSTSAASLTPNQSKKSGEETAPFFSNGWTSQILEQTVPVCPPVPQHGERPLFHSPRVGLTQTTCIMHLWGWTIPTDARLRQRLRSPSKPCACMPGCHMYYASMGLDYPHGCQIETAPPLASQAICMHARMPHGGTVPIHL